MPDAYVVITGNPVDGLFFYGPFDSYDEATAYAERNHDGDDWWATKLQQPEEEDDE